MKKNMIILSLFLVVFAAKGTAQTIYLYNNTVCGVSITLYAEDTCTPSGCGYYVSKPISLGAGSGAVYNGEPGINYPGACLFGAGPGWASGGPCYPFCVKSLSPYGWDGAEVDQPGYFSAPITAEPTGAPGCIVNSSPQSDCTLTTTYADWTYGLGTITLTVHY